MKAVYETEQDDGSLESALCELTLIVRPEDKAAVTRVLVGEVGGGFTAYHALGRGFDGGMQYSNNSASLWSKWFQPAAALAFLPKIALWLVVDEHLAHSIVERVGAAIRLVGGPSQCAGGYAIIAPLGEELPVGITPHKGRELEDEPDAFTEDVREEPVFA